MDPFDAPIDFEHVESDPRHPDPCTPEWRMRAIQLAFERNMAGQAYCVSVHIAERASTYRCVSASEPQDHYITLFIDPDRTIACDCTAGKYQRPCSHAGAVLLLDAGYAPPRTRDESGAPRGTGNAQER